MRHCVETTRFCVLVLYSNPRSTHPPASSIPFPFVRVIVAAFNIFKVFYIFVVFNLLHKTPHDSCRSNGCRRNIFYLVLLSPLLIPALHSLRYVVDKYILDFFRRGVVLYVSSYFRCLINEAEPSARSLNRSHTLLRQSLFCSVLCNL